MSNRSVPGTDSRLARVDPLLLALAGAACTSLSGVLVKASGANAGTAAFLRCALALTLLVPMAAAEIRRIGWRPRRLVLIDTAAGLLLGVDYVLWAASIGEVGAGIATVLLNAQLVVFPLLALVFTGTPVRRSFLVAAPVMLAGVALAAGITGPSTAEGDPVLGLVYGCAAGAAYAGYLFLSRLGGGSGHTATPVCVATLAGALSAGVLGAWWSGIDLASLDSRAWGWLALLALTGQVLTWILVGAALPRLAPSSGAAVLVLPPVLAVGAGALLLGERATPVQLAGCALVVAAVWASERAARTARRT
ncbi:DMT family transporter [Nocardiopsis aegyptia]|uniref:DMT family transporter n=1 Tax=Nocardiopsis aegyptia TaxID=220378 RepID=UPI00366E74F5